MMGNVRCPRAEATVPVDRSHPLRQKLALRLLLLIVLTLYFQHQHFPVRQADEIVGAELADDAFE